MNQKPIPLKVYFGKYFITTSNWECKVMEVGGSKWMHKGGEERSGVGVWLGVQNLLCCCRNWSLWPDCFTWVHFTWYIVLVTVKCTKSWAFLCSMETFWVLRWKCISPPNPGLSKSLRPAPQEQRHPPPKMERFVFLLWNILKTRQNLPKPGLGQVTHLPFQTRNRHIYKNLLIRGRKNTL